MNLIQNVRKSKEIDKGRHVITLLNILIIVLYAVCAYSIPVFALQQNSNFETIQESSTQITESEWKEFLKKYCSDCKFFEDENTANESDNEVWIEHAKTLEKFKEKNDYSPIGNELVFFNVASDSKLSEIGIVIGKQNDNEIKVIRGDGSGKIVQNLIALDDSTIIGYVVLNNEINRDIESNNEIKIEENNIANKLKDNKNSLNNECSNLKNISNTIDLNLIESNETTLKFESKHDSLNRKESNIDASLFQGYRETIKYNGDYVSEGLFVKDEGEQIAYCYNQKKAYPPIENPPTYNGEDDRAYYTRIIDYLGSEDESVIFYGREIKEKVALALYAGYPCDALGHLKKIPGVYLTENDARTVMQRMVWDITEGAEGEYYINDSYYWPTGWSRAMVLYYNAIYNDMLKGFKSGDVFYQGRLKLTGNFTLIDRGDYWSTEEINTEGEKGVIHFTNIPSGLKIIDWNTDEDVTENGISVGKSIYIKSDVPQNASTKFTATITYPQVKFYFYKWAEIGGFQIADSKGKRIQNLIRVEETDNILSQSYEITMDGKVTTTKSISVKKIWKGAAADSVKVNLYADNQFVRSADLSEENFWQYEFTDLPKMKDGKKIQYSVQEEPVPGYKTKIDGNMDQGYVITNTLEGHIMPSTGGFGNENYYHLGILLIMASTPLIIKKQISKKRRLNYKERI